MNGFRNFVFSLYERDRVRKWAYTLAFAISVPTGFRFAVLAWEYGDWFDKPLSIVAGLAIGVTAVVTLLRIWTVPPRQTVENAALFAAMEALRLPPAGSRIHDDAVRQAARNREIAKGAAALGSTHGSAHGWPFGHF
ncbi:MAG TPA: hypothetical protein VMG40_08625 [Bryobacteraceae bacterium]|nr:hypothetical protein [Bryobacteraceae bacterium]